MLPLYEDPFFTFRFAEARIVPRFHLAGVPLGCRVSVYQVHPDTGERLGLLDAVIVGAEGWVELSKPLVVQAGDVFIAVPERACSSSQQAASSPCQAPPGFWDGED